MKSIREISCVIILLAVTTMVGCGAEYPEGQVLVTGYQRCSGSFTPGLNCDYLGSYDLFSATEASVWAFVFDQGCEMQENLALTVTLGADVESALNWEGTLVGSGESITTGTNGYDAIVTYECADFTSANCYVKFSLGAAGQGQECTSRGN